MRIKRWLKLQTRYPINLSWLMLGVLLILVIIGVFKL
jgi:hypothetical protein